MPPRVRLKPSAAQQIIPQSSIPSSSSSSSSSFACTSRQFSASPHHSTRLRRRMFQWLDGPGSNFRSPLVGTTNYLGAYDRDWRLRREMLAEKKKRENAIGKKDKVNDDATGKDDPDASPEEIQARAAANEVEAEEGEEGEGEGEVEETQSDQEQPGRKQKVNVKDLPPEDEIDLRPFPQNPFYVSQPVLNEGFRELIYQKVVEQGERVVKVSSQYSVTMERVAAVVRMKTMEKQWEKEEKFLAIPYSKSVLSMVPTTKAPRRNDRFERVFHEPINDLPVHRATVHQMFWPAPESREFSRATAAQAFYPTLLPAETRIPHPEMVVRERARNAMMSPQDVADYTNAFVQKEEQNRRRVKEGAEEATRRHTKVVEGRRWDFKFSDVIVEDAGKDGRGEKGVGWRYGMPHEDRKKGQVKIPTSVEA